VRSEISRLYLMVLPVLVAVAGFTFLLRDFIITVLFTEAFAPMRELFGWQVIADVLKLGSWILAFVMLGRAMTKVFVVTETLFHVSLFILSWQFSRQMGLSGIPVAFAVNAALYWLTMAILIRMEMRRMEVVP
jgi:PST family polysaccharide transporter